MALSDAFCSCCKPSDDKRGTTGHKWAEDAGDGAVAIESADCGVVSVEFDGRKKQCYISNDQIKKQQNSSPQQ
jgi:hypothetical protein